MQLKTKRRQSNHFGMMQCNLIFQTYSNNLKKHSIHTHVSQFNFIRVNIHSIQSRKYLFNPITEIFIQFNSNNYLFNPIIKIFIYLLKYQLSFNPFHSHSCYSIHSKTYSMQSSRNSFNLPGASAAKAEKPVLPAILSAMKVCAECFI